MRVTTLQPIEIANDAGGGYGSLYIDVRGTVAHGANLRITFFEFVTDAASYGQQVALGWAGDGEGWVDANPASSNSTPSETNYTPATTELVVTWRPTDFIIIDYLASVGGGSPPCYGTFDFFAEYFDGAAWQPLQEGTTLTFRAFPGGLGAITAADPVGDGLLSATFEGGGDDIATCFWTDLTFVTQSACLPPDDEL